MKKILFQGDSITDAIRAYDNDQYRGSGYATMVSGALNFDIPGKYECINRGISGNRITDLYARSKRDIINLSPDYLSILIGVNDVWHEYPDKIGVSAERYENLYEMLIEDILVALPDVKIMILEPFVLKGCATNELYDTFYPDVVKRAEISKKIADKFGLVFVPLQAALEEKAKISGNEFILYDGVHPTAAGHEIIKRKWLEAFENIK